MARRVKVLATGGTISTQGEIGSATPTSKAQDLLDTIEPLPDGVEVVGVEDVTHVISPALSLSDMWDIVSRATEVAESGEADGIVVTHGTATVADTAFLAYLVWAQQVGIAFTGAMATGSRVTRDGPRNIRDAILAAADPRLAGAGPLLVLNERIHSPRYVYKAHNSAFDTFTSGDYGTFGYVDDDLVGVTAMVGAPPRLAPARPDDDDVPLVKAYSGMPDLLVRAAIDAGPRGLVLETLPGRGGVPPKLQGALEEALESGLLLVLAGNNFGRVSPTYSGVAHSGHYIARGAIPGGDLRSQRARILLSLLLAGGADDDTVRQVFAEVAP